MKIAIVGGGISGLVAGYRLHPHHDVSLFEAADYIGGHTNTVDVETPDGPLAVDTGFIVFNDRTYPNFIALLEELGVESQPSIMSFSVKCEATGLEYRGADFAGLFAQRRNLVNPKFYRLLWDIVRFNKLGNRLLESTEPEDESETVDSFLSRNRFSKSFVNQYFLPMGAAIWSSSYKLFRQFPIRFIAEFYLNHGLLGITNRPKWRVIKGGSKSYLEPLLAGWREKVRLSTPVTKVLRSELAAEEGSAVEVVAGGESHFFDHVIFACHSDQALRILGDQATKTEREILSQFPYQKNVALLHTQESLLPVRRGAWASWNYFNPVAETDAATVTYCMNILQSLKTKKTYCVTLNGEDQIDPQHVIRRFEYSHPTFSVGRKSMQARQDELIDCNETSFCGAYWGNGFHEDGVASAIAVVNRIQGRFGTPISSSLERTNHQQQLAESSSRLRVGETSS
jgi:predicted NAD/FAD-binding protein